jgi:hypothetical protein
MKYRCICGNISYITFCNFKTGQMCRKCSGSEKHTFEYVKHYFIENGCELLEEKYIDNKHQMKYRCCCGNVSKIRFDSFKLGRRCMKCKGY